MIFKVNGTIWHVEYKKPYADDLKRSDGTYTIGMTDGNTHCIYVLDTLRGALLRKVLIHEICHAICMSYDIYLPIEQEEVLCDFVATYGEEVFYILDMILCAEKRAV